MGEGGIISGRSRPSTFFRTPLPLITFCFILTFFFREGGLVGRERVIKLYFFFLHAAFACVLARAWTRFLFVFE